jgi:hypothetical protein
MQINSKLPEFKNFLTENRMSTTHRETNVDNSGVSSTTQQSVLLDMESESSADSYSEKNKKKKNGKKGSEGKSAKSKNEAPVKTQEEFRAHNFKLLNLL